MVDDGVIVRSERSLHGQVVRRLGLAIARSDVKQGDILPDEAGLSSRFGVSRTVVREAVKALAAKGMVEPRPKIGTRVRPRREWNLLDPDVLGWRYEAGPDEGFLRDLVEVRRMIEPAAAGLAAERATLAEVAAIEHWYGRMDALVAAEASFIDADMGFHGAILAATHNELLQSLGEAIGLVLRFSRTVTVQVPGSSAASMPLHWAISEAIRDRDPAAAERRMADLLRRTAADIAWVLGDRPGPENDE